MAKTLATGIRRSRHVAVIDEIVASRLGAVELERALVYLVDAVPSEVLPYLAEQFDVLGYKGWALIGKTYRPSFEDPLESVTAPARAYGIRRLNPEYSGPIVRLRRSSDNAESDFSALPEGGLNLEAIKEFLLSQEGNVVRIYNQVADEAHLEAPDPGAEPVFSIDGLGGRPSIVFDGFDDNISADPIGTGPFDVSIIASQSAGETEPNGVLFGYADPSGLEISRNEGGESIAVKYSGSTLFVVPTPNGRLVSILVRKDASSVNLFVNGELFGTADVGASPDNDGPIIIGATGSGDRKGRKTFSELVFWDSNIPEGDRDRFLLRSMQYYGLAAPTPDVVDEAAIDRQRRDLIKKAIELHRYKGTPYSVKEAIRSVGFRDARVIEKVGIKYNAAVAYDGSQTYGSGFPFNFRVVFDLGSQQGITAERIEDLAALIDEYKNVRSRLVDIAFEATLEESSFATDTVELAIEFVGVEEAALRQVRYDAANKYGGAIQHDSTMDSLGTNI